MGERVAPCWRRAGPLCRPTGSARSALVVTAAVSAAVAATFGTAAGTTRQLRRYSGRDWSFDELDAVRVCALGSTGGFDRNNGDPLDAELRLGTHDIACFCPTI
jgi:hypothetical protein